PARAARGRSRPAPRPSRSARPGGQGRRGGRYAGRLGGGGQPKGQGGGAAGLCCCPARPISCSMPALLCDFEPDWLTCLPLFDRGSLGGVPVGSHILDAEPDQVAGAELAVYSEVEEG